MSYLSSAPEHRLKMIAFGVVLPVLTLLFEVATGLSADAFVDPVPDITRLLAVLMVPVTAGLLLWGMPREGNVGAAASALTGFALGVAALYAILYLPLMPFAIPGLLVGIGFFPLAPLASLIAIWLFTREARGRGAFDRRWPGAGCATAVLLLLAMDAPAAIARLAVDRQHRGDPEGALSLARMGASESWLVAAANDRLRPLTGVPTLLADWQSTSARWETPRPSRELLFRLTGQGHDSLPLPERSPFRRLKNQFWFDRDAGGDEVGNRVVGLSLAASRMDMEVLPEANAAYVEWTAEFANNSPSQQEARLTLALPEGAVASRAVLWVDGEPREASVATRGAARAAYRSVVSVQRDPLLVTTDGSGRLLVQAFPVPAGERLKLRIGVTAPLMISSEGGRSVGLPAIVQRNFGIAPGLRHNIQVDGADDASGIPLNRGLTQDGRLLLSGLVSDDLLWSRTARLSASPVVESEAVFGKLDGMEVRQTIAPAAEAAVAPLILLVDGSASNKVATSTLIRSLDAIAPGFPVGLVVAGETLEKVDVAPWSAGQKARIVRMLARQPFEGGHDNVPALMAAMDGAGVILWVHGVQPIRFADSTSELEARLERGRGKLPRLVRFQAVPGPAFGLPGKRWLDTAREVAPTAGGRQGLDSLLSELTGLSFQWAVSRQQMASGVGQSFVRGGDQIVRLWAAGEAGVAHGEDRRLAAKQAATLGLVASDTGAVVLETDAETREKGLPAPPSAIPAVPEPDTWVMLIGGFFLLGWQMRRQRSRLTSGAGK